MTQSVHTHHLNLLWDEQDCKDLEVLLSFDQKGMALSSAPCPLGASLPSSLPPELSPNPAATTTSAAVIPWTAAAAPHPTASVPSPQLSPLAAMFISRGRPKEERWRDHSVSPLSEFGSPPVKNLTASFHDMLLVPSVPAASVAVGTVVTVVTEPPAPRNRTATPARGAPLAAREEWQRVESRRSWKRRLRAAERLRRLVPADLAGVCFNYFFAVAFLLPSAVRRPSASTTVA
jgi:hypothetical protein